MKTKHLITTLSIAALTLTGCGSNSDEPEAAPQPEPVETAAEATTEDTEDFNPMDGAGNMPAGTFEVYPELGGHATLQIPTDNNNEEVQQFEEYRQANNLEPLTYLVIDIDNRDGSEMLKFPQVTVFDEPGNTYDFQHIDSIITEWSPERSWDMDDEEFWAPDGTTISFEEYQDLESQYTELADNINSSVSAAEANSIILAYPGDDLPDEYTRVATITYGIGYEQDAYPAD